jgi:hypothetical protein
MYPSEPGRSGLQRWNQAQIGGALFGLDRLGFGFEVDCDLKEHFRDTHIVAGAGHLPCLRRPVSEVVRVQRESPVMKL